MKALPSGCRHRALVSVCLLLLLAVPAFALPRGTDGHSAVRAAVLLETPTPETRYVYLPLTLRLNLLPPPQGIHGVVTYNRVPAADVRLLLSWYDGSDWFYAATTTTSADGRYDFVGVPSLAAGQAYYVLYGPNRTSSTYLYSWAGPTITSYTAGTVLPGGEFDIANVFLLSPQNGSTLALPVTFTWQPRGLPEDTYRLVVFDPLSTDQWVSDDLGDVDSATITGLAPGMVYDKGYGWFVRVYNGPDSYGTSFSYRLITFPSRQAASPAGTPAGSASNAGGTVLRRAGEPGVGMGDRMGLESRGGRPGTLEGDQSP
jgi:hypothetical protein